jgi:hypothetical protein
MGHCAPSGPAGQSKPSGNIHLNTALLALAVGLSPGLPTEDGLKRPDGLWKQYQTTPATREEVIRWYRRRRSGNALFTGYGDLEALEWDSSGAAYQPFLDAAEKLGLGDLVERIRNGYEERSPSGGFHWLYRCSEGRGNTELAKRPNPDDPDKPKILIETRGVGGFLVIAPSNGKVHPSGGTYTLLHGGLETIATITPDEREALWRLARTFDEMPEEPKPERPPQAGSGQHQDGVRPGDDFNAKARWEDILEPAGWEPVHASGAVTYWRRPDKDKGWSATTGKTKGFKVFTSSTSLRAGESYSPFGLYCQIRHQGNWTACVKDLVEQGYGTWIDEHGEEHQNPPPKGQRPAATTRTAAPSANGAGLSHPADKGPDDDTEVVDYWPEAKPEAFHGIAGEIVELVDPHTEADPIAILIQFLVAFANLVGRLPHFMVSGTRHYLNLFVALVGATAVGRKGTSWDVVTWLLRVIDPEWADGRIQSGLVSGEGLIYHVRDESTTKHKGKPVVDPGVTDKRLLVVETELSRTLKAMGRDGCTLSDVLRQAWDHGNLRVLSKNQPVAATGAHISIVGHATQADIRRLLTETDMANGFGNRLLWPAVRRSKVLPEGGELDRVNWTPITRKLTAIVATIKAWPDPKMRRDATAGKVWAGIYEPLSAGKPGLLGAILSRAEAQVMRLACVFAMLDRSREVRAEHLVAAVALWDYCEASARFIFGDSLGDPDAEKLLDALRKAKDGLTRKQIYVDVFHGHKKSGDIVKLLSNLLTSGLIHRGSLPCTGGRPAEVWLIGRDPKTVRTNAH